MFRIGSSIVWFPIPSTSDSSFVVYFYFVGMVDMRDFDFLDLLVSIPVGIQISY